MLSDEVLDNHISHAVPVGIAILVKAMHSAEDQLVEGQGPILAPHCLGRRMLAVSWDMEVRAGSMCSADAITVLFMLAGWTPITSCLDPNSSRGTMQKQERGCEVSQRGCGVYFSRL